MNKVLNIVKNPWVLGIAGLAALGVLIWTVGPLISVGDATPFASEAGRWISIGVLGSAYGLFKIQSYISTLRNNRRMVGDILGRGGQAKRGAAGGAAASPEEQAQRESAAASAEEVATLKHGLDDALKTLRKAKFGDRRGRGQQYLYQLPWYIIIGPPGSGKTTALVNSELNFPIGSDKVRGVGGTRNCDWWFTDEAVLLDTAGRYTTQDSQQPVDQAAWRGFLDLLKKHRRRRPINGVLVAISLKDLLEQNEGERAAQAQAIKERIQELHEHLGIRFPVYVLFTKSDLIAGFVEFFNDLGREERMQVWGVTLPMDDPINPKGVVDHFSPEFDLLEQRLNDRLVERLYEEKDPLRRDIVYSFPQQFSSLKDIANQFLEQVFRPSVYAERTLLRGVYFTSGTQEGNPIDRLLGALAANFKLSRQAVTGFSGKGKSYFLTRLFRDVVFEEADLAGTNLRLERWRSWMQRGAYAGALLITALVAAAWFASYVRNQAYVNTVETQRQVVLEEAKKLSPQQRDLLATLPMLNSARAIPGGYEDRTEGVPWLMGFGLYQGDKLGSEAKILYRYLLNRAFLPRIMLRLEEQLRQDPADSAFLYEALKIYLMLGESQHFDAAAIQNWMKRDWAQATPRLSQEQQNQLLAHLNALLEDGPVTPPLDLDRNLIEFTRARIRQTPLSQRVYDWLKQDYQAGTVPDFQLLDAAGPDTPRVLERLSSQPLSVGISGLYTRAGYYQVFGPQNQRLVNRLADESWVLGGDIPLGEGERQQLTAQVCRLYLQDYGQQWSDLLGDIKLKGFTSPAEAAEQLKVLSDFDSPLGKLVRAVAHETDLEPQAAPAPAEGAAQPAPETAKAETSVCNLSQLEARFAPYQREVAGVDGGIPALDTTLATLGDMFGFMNAIVRAGEGGTVSQDLKDKVNEVANRLEVEAARKPPPLNAMLQKLARDSTDSIRSLRDRLNTLWKTAQIAPYFENNLSGRYPLARSSIQWAGQAPAATSQPATNVIQWSGGGGVSSPAAATATAGLAGPTDMSLDAFGRFFGPGGLMDDFFQKNLRAYVDTTQGTWAWRGPGGPDDAVTADALLAFQRAAAVKEALFDGGGQRPSIRFELAPKNMGPAISQAVLTIDGQQVNYRISQTGGATALRWPGPSGGQARLQLEPILPGNRSELSESGPWAWFRLLDGAEVRSTTQPGSFEVTFHVGNRLALYDMRVNSAFNPFRLRELEIFRCPQQL
ncbi:MAG: type VI secretion system membrane subunit TssM [Gammaproteobacteria bacterium]|nr:type VI secretion system membrane subunit TssM [Gammaproteobacteria bacterium]MCP5459622.1 type VI secretion system membrane subunit TssM [Gammaproteobacteria bacterium]